MILEVECLDGKKLTFTASSVTVSCDGYELLSFSTATGDVVSEFVWISRDVKRVTIKEVS